MEIEQFAQWREDLSVRIEQPGAPKSTYSIHITAQCPIESRVVTIEGEHPFAAIIDGLISVNVSLSDVVGIEIDRVERIGNVA